MHGLRPSTLGLIKAVAMVSLVACQPCGAAKGRVWPECYGTNKLPTEPDPCKSSFTATAPAGGTAGKAGVTRYCMTLSSTRACDPAASECCPSAATGVSVYEVQLFTQQPCVLGPSGAATKKNLKWTLDGKAITPVVDTKTPAFKLRRKWWGTATLCVEVPSTTTSPCIDLSSICALEGCEATLVTTPFKQTPTSKNRGCKMPSAVDLTCSTACTKIVNGINIGQCSASNTCSYSGSEYLPSSAVSCPPTIVPECINPCLNGGACTATNTCDCTGTGYAGASCETLACGGGLCPGSQQCCPGNACRDVQEDAENCGTCGNVCPGTQVCSAGTCQPCPVGGTYIYGIADNQVIYETDVTNQEVSGVYNALADIGTGLANAFAYDTSRNQFFFLTSKNQLAYWPRTGSVQTIATAAEMGLAGKIQPADAVYYDNAFWFVENTATSVDKQKLVKVELDYDASGVPSFGRRHTYHIDIKDAAGNPVKVYDMFGDIAVDGGGNMYFATSPYPGQSTSGAFYKLDLNTLGPAGGTGTATMIKPPSKGNISLQLSFSCDFKTLWGHDYNTADWYTIDTATGDITKVFRGTLPNSGKTTGLRDLGGAACTCAPKHIT